MHFDIFTVHYGVLTVHPSLTTFYCFQLTYVNRPVIPKAIADEFALVVHVSDGYSSFVCDGSTKQLIVDTAPVFDGDHFTFPLREHLSYGDQVQVYVVEKV